MKILPIVSSSESFSEMFLVEQSHLSCFLLRDKNCGMQCRAGETARLWGTATSMAPFSRPPQPSSDNLRSVIQLSSERSYLYWNTTTDSSCKMEICLSAGKLFYFTYIWQSSQKRTNTVSVFLFMLHIIKWFILLYHAVKNASKVSLKAKKIKTCRVKGKLSCPSVTMMHSLISWD